MGYKTWEGSLVLYHKVDREASLEEALEVFVESTI